MGLLNSLFKAIGAIKDMADELEKQSKGSPSASSSRPAAAQQPAPEQQPSPEMSVCEKLDKVFAEKFPQYTIKKNVQPSTIGGQGKFMDYSYGVYSGAEPRLFIMIVGKTTCSSRLYRWSKEEAARRGINMINFVEHYPNEMEYIESRLAQYI